MGKLTGPSNKPLGQGESQANTKQDDGEHAATVSAENSPAPNPSNGTASVNTPKSNNEQQQNLRISYRNRRSTPTRKSAPESFSSSMISAVNNAAETARQVLDAADGTAADDNRSLSSHGSRVSAGSVHSIHSFNSRRSAGGSSYGGLSMGDYTYQTALANEGEGKMGGDEDDIMIDDTAEIEEATSAESFRNDSFIVRSTNSSVADGAPFSPPPTAFQNLPMTRGFTPTHKSPGDMDDVLAEGKVFEVTNHFDAAAAISAALASSHLAQATGGVGQLQMPKHSHPYPAIQRRISLGEGDRPPKESPLRRSHSGDAVTEIAKAMETLEVFVDSNVPLKGSEGQESSTKRKSGSLPTPEEAEKEMLQKRASWISVDDLSIASTGSDRVKRQTGTRELTSNKQTLISDNRHLNINPENETTQKGNEQVNHDTPKNEKQTPDRNKATRNHQGTSARRLPSRKEAKVAMLSNRTSFVSVDDLSIGSDQDMVAALKKLADARARQAAHQNHAEKGTDSEGREDSTEAKKKNDGGNEATKKSTDDSASHCSGSSGYENESNTSSVTNTHYSDVSPISMSTAGGPGEEKQNANNSKGMLGNLAKTRRSALSETNHSYDGADDEYSTQSENSGKPLPPLLRRRNEKKDGKSKKVTICSKHLPAGPIRNQQGMMFDATSENAQMIDPPGSSAVKDGDSSTSSKENHSKSSAWQTLHPAPTHRVSLFDSFDRNWEQAVQDCKNPDRMLDLGRKCFASFAIVFGSCKDANGRPIFGNAISNNSGADEKFPSFRWWVDDNALTNAGDVMHRPKPPKDCVIGAQEKGGQDIPIAVIHTLWKACIFDVEGDKSNGETDKLVDLIQNILVHELCYFTTTATSSVPCLRLSLAVYAEYGWYILRRFAMQEQVSIWHSKFADVLRQLVLNNSLSDADSMIKRRYAALSLPRHTAIGLLHVDPEGHFQIADTEEKRTELRTHLFVNLLCDKDFIKSRAKLLGRGKSRPDDADETLFGNDANPQIAKLISQARDNDHNMLYSTTAHVRDIVWCASLCVADSKDGDDLANNHHDKEKGDVFSVTDCLNAISKWKEELISSYHVLHVSGKLTISDNEAKGPNEKCKSKDETTQEFSQVAQLAEDYNDGNHDESPGGAESCLDVANTLLSTGDAWTSKRTPILEKDASSKVSSPRPHRKGRRHQKESTSTATTLVRILNIDINDLRTAVSVGRSLLGIAEFSQFMLDGDMFKVEAKDSSAVTSHSNGLQSSCLKNAIEILSSSATTLGYLLCSSLDKVDEDDLDETVSVAYRKKSMGPAALLQLFDITREASKPLLSVAGILCADAWYLLGKLISKACKLETNGHVVLFSYERALLILNSPHSASLNKPALDLLCETFLSPLTHYKAFLQSNINHSIGVYSYEQGDFVKAADYLGKAALFQRQMLDDLRGDDAENNDQAKGLSKLFNAVVGGMKSDYLVSPESMSEEVFTNVFEYSISHGCIQLLRESFEVDELELSLSLTLEYSALTKHAVRKYQMALSYFQESLILRTMHVGKHSLDVASLHFNMGVVYDDLEQHDQAISRYHESLRIRLDQMTKATSTAPELEDSVLLTLKCMGHVYKLTGDLDNAICCYVKALEMVNQKFSTLREHADEWSKMGLRLGLAVPVPTVIFADMKSSTDTTSWKTHFQIMNKKELCHVFEPRLTKRRSRSTASKLKRELSKIHSIIIDLVQERKQKSLNTESGSLRSNKLPGSSSMLLASLPSTFKAGGDAFEAALMRSSFSLGRMRLEQMRYEEAADYLETALRSKWVLDPGSSSDSDSDFSLKSLSTRKHQATRLEEDNPEEGQLYYSLGICNAAMDDHERAVRCFLTAMRYLRRSLRRVDSLEVARVLFDCATSHYYLCNFEQSVSLYEECLRILKTYDSPNEGDEENTPSANNDSKSKTFRRGVTLYCLVMAKAAIDFDAEASNLLNEAQMLLSSSNDQIILAYMEFLTGLFLHHAASQVPVRLRAITRISSTGLSLNDGLSWNEMCQSALNLLDQVKNECWFDPMEGVEDSDEVRHLPLSGHICFIKGQVYELIDSVDQALNSYVDAANFYRIACGDENMYVASVLHRMGLICSLRTEFHALGYFNEALSIRKNLLGGNDHLVAETLYSSAIVLARLNRYEASMERYHEALRIQMAVSQDSNEVARTLAGMGICHYNNKAFDLALTCLEGTVKIRKYRVSRLTDSAELVELYGEECSLGSDFYNLGNVHMQMGDYAQAMQCFIQSRDLRWCHVGSGTVTKILEKYFSETTVDEDELLGLAHCLHNIGVMFDIKKEYKRSLPHYEEALAIKNAIAGFSDKDSMSLVNKVDRDENEALVLQSLHKDHEFPRINKATLSASVTRQKIAGVYVKQRKYDHALFHFSHALRIQRQVLGKDHFRVGSILTSMGNALRRTSTPSETAIMCYNESLRISRLRFGQNHVSVASALFDIGNLHDSNQDFSQAMNYYQRALSVYKQKYSQQLRQRLCSGLEKPNSSTDSETPGTEVLSTGDEIVVAGDASGPEKQIRDQYALVTKALRNAKRQDLISRGEGTNCIGDTNDAWLTFEILFFRFVEMLSTYVVDPAQTVMLNTIESSRRRIESAAAHAIIGATDALDYQFQLLLQE